MKKEHTIKIIFMAGCIIVSLIAFIVTGCNNQVDNGNVFSLQKDTVIEQKVILRNLGINSNNAYNDLFLDSPDVERFIVKEKLNDTLSIAMRSFYNARNYEFAWFASSGLIEQSFSFRSLYSSENEVDQLNKPLEKRLDRLRMDKDTAVGAKDPYTIQTELQITERFIQYAVKHYTNMGISLTALGNYIPSKRKMIIDLADSVLANNSINNNYAALNEAYKRLKVPLRQYSAIEKNGGLPVIPGPSKKYIAGLSTPGIAIIKKRLQITGELSGTDSTELFDTALDYAVKTYQVSHGYQPSGLITEGLLKNMNIPALARIQQLIINMQRMRWMPTQPDGILIIVNIPEFEVYVDSGKTILFQMDVVVGAQGHNTTMFSGNLAEVVFSPYWNLPPSIVRKEVLPGIRREKEYLEKRDMEITGHEGGLPVVRQRPGEKNALGKVKFLFPNSFNIYMHDTPEKNFFNRSKRSLSHGCIRLSNAPKLAYYLLQKSTIWTPEKIDAAMNSVHEQFVHLKTPIPVIITYYTAWVDNKGILHFADDIYNHDRQMAKKMFANPQ